MEDKDYEIKDSIDYSTQGEREAIVFLEDICMEFNIDLKKYWVRAADEDDWFLNDDNMIVSQHRPIMPERYELTYSLLYDDNSEKIVRFADYLIFNLMSDWSHLEACLRKEIDNKKEDTE